jgi:hypothetical protein
MRLDEIFEGETLLETRMVWRKQGNKITRAFRCTSGVRKGRVVKSGSDCSKPIDIKKRFTLKKTKARMGKRMARKAKRTKRMNPASKRLKSMNRPLRKR